MDEKYWKQFESSGRVEDYLSFVSSVRRQTGGKQTAGRMGEGSHAGIYIGDRDHSETEPGRGI